jgi:sodium-dependent dicarboxylate transporter 2/3/5
MWMSNTAVAAMMMPFAMCFLGAFRGTDRGDAFMGSGALMVAYAASVGGIATPVGTPPNLITLAFLDKAAGIRITFFEWMLVGVPLSLLMTGVLFIVLRVLAGRLHGGAVQSEALSRCEIELEPKLSRGEVNTLVVFAVVVLLWVAPGVIGILLGAKSRLYELYDSRMPEAAAALAGAVLLFLLPVDGKRGDSTMTWEEASKINWGTILLFGGGLSLGTLMFKTGLGEALGTSLLHVTGTMGLFMLTLVATVSAVVLTEFTSNTATANIVIPVVLSLARALNLPPLVPILGACFGSSMGFMLPVGTPPNAIAYATGRVSITRMLCTGVLIDLASIPAIVLVLYGAHAFGIV